MSKIFSALKRKKFIPVYICFLLTLILYGSIYIMAMVPADMFFGLGIPEEFITHFVKLLPGPMWSDICLLYISPVICFLLLKTVAPYTTLFYAKFHKLFYSFRTKPEYGIYLKESKEIPAGRMLLRILKLSFMAFAFTGFFIPQLAGAFRANYDQVYSQPELAALFNAEALFLGTFFFSSLIMVIFFPIWFLEDSGVIAYRKFKDKRMNPDIEAVNRIFRDFLEYFVGFTTILVYINRVYFVLNQETRGFTEMNPTVLIPIILIFLPFLIGGLVAIPLILYELTFDKTNKRVQDFLGKRDYELIDIPDFTDLKIANKKSLEETSNI